MTSQELRKKYLEFFESKGHKVIPSASLIPENDPSVLFTTAGMHPLVPYLLGEKHPSGTRLVNVQKCIRTGDIDEVGDNTHLTFFEMMGNWSLRDYWKKEAIEMTFEFHTKIIGIPLEKYAVSCFVGDNDAPRDNESFNIWISLGVLKERIAFLPKKDNWWGPAGETGPCGPDTEMFYWKDNNNPVPDKYDTEDDRWVEIWNDVFMQYNKTKDNNFVELSSKNVDTGLGVERVAMMLQGETDIFATEVFKPIIDKITDITGVSMKDSNVKSFRVISDHIKAATHILGDERGVVPSNVDQGYILRRYIRRIIRHLRLLGLDVTSMDATVELSKVVIEMYKEDYPLLEDKKDFIFDELKKEEDKFQKTLDKGLRGFEKMAEDGNLDSKEAFLLYQSYGFPIEMIEEMAKEKNVKVDVKGFDEEYKNHQELSRKGAEQKFKGGLSEASDVTAKLHTATHILGEALRKILGSDEIKQKGSNINPDRLRYDFNFERKLTPEEKQAVEDEVNRVIEESIDVKREEMSLKDAMDLGAQAEFGARYPDKVSVYSIGDYTKDICMGPHVKNTSEIGYFKIKKEESSSAGIRRIKAVLK